MESTRFDADKVLVAYFIQKGKETSGSKKAADKIMAAIEAKGYSPKEYAITPVETYPEDQATFEMVAKLEKDNRTRPELVDKVGKMQDYRYIVIAAPNWFDDLPMAVYSFFDQYDFDEKRIVLAINHEGTGFEHIRDSVRNFLHHTWVMEGVGIQDPEGDDAAVASVVEQLFQPNEKK